MGRLLVHLRQMAASTCDRLQLYKDIYFSPNWWHHRVLQLCIIGKEAPLMYWSPCCVTRGFKKNHSHSLTAWKNNGVCGPDCHSHLLSPPASVWDSKSQWGQLAGWMTVDVYLHTCVKVSEFVCVSFFVCDPKRSEFKLWFTESHVVPLPTGRRALSICCLHSHRHMQIHTLGEKKTEQRSVQSHVPAGTYMSSCKYADTCMKNSRTHIIQRMFRSPSVNNWCTVFPAQTHTSCLSLWGDNRARIGVYFMLLTSNNIKWNPQSYANGQNENINIKKKTPKTKSS